MRKRLAKFTLLVLSCALVVLAACAGPAGAASNWKLRQLPPAQGQGPWGPPLSGVSCPTESLCVAVGGLNTIAFSQTPTAGAAGWHVINPSYPIGPGKTCVEGEAHCHVPSGAINAVSCASPSLCAAVTYDGFILVSTDPTGGPEAWTATPINDPGTGATHLISVSCPSPSLCVAVSGGSNNSNGGRILTSTNPTAGQWQVTGLGSSLDLRGVSCGTPSLCVAVAREGRIFVSTDPTGGASAWRAAGTPGGPGDLEGVSCVSGLLCAAGNLTGNMLTSTEPAGGGATWREVDAGGSVQITGVSCPTASGCVAVDNNADVLTSSNPTGGAGSWHFENLVPFHPTEEIGQPPRNALFAASCASTSLCALVGIDGRIFTATDPFSAPDPPGNRRARRRPRTILVFAENFWKLSHTRHRRLRARFRFYSPTRNRGFECKPDGRRYRRCDSPLRYWVGHGRHVLRVRAIGPTGLRGPAAVKRFRVLGRHRRFGKPLRAETVTGDNVRIGFRAWIRPKTLPRGEPSAVSLHLAGRVHPIGDRRPSALERVTIQINRHAVFSTHGLPRCPHRRLVATHTAAAIARCGAALIGSGRFRSHIDIPEQAPFPAVGRVLAFNTTLHGRRAVALHVSGTDPVPTTTVLIGRLTGSRPTPGQFGSELTIEMPRIGDEWGYVTGFDLTLHRRYRYRGQEMSVVSASCPAPAGFDRVLFKAARGTFELADGHTLTRTLSGSCRALR